MRPHVLLLFVAALGGALAWGAPASAQEARQAAPRGPRVVRSGEHEAVLVPLEQSREALSPEERELVEMREEMRELRAERREAIQRARESGDPEALARVQEEYRPRMEELRDRVRESRDAVMEVRLRENPELAARLASGRPGRDRFECGGGPGQASDDARRRAFRRLQAIAPAGTLNDPSDIPTAVRQELSTHARRTALLQCIRTRANEKQDAEVAQRARLVLRAEQGRHDRVIRELLGAPPAAAPAAEPTPASTAPATPTDGREEGAR